MYLRVYVKYTLFLSDFNQPWIFFTEFRKNPEILNFMKIRQLESGLCYANRQAGMTKLIVAFCNFANAPKNSHFGVEVDSTVLL
jgi:hypothetical protein